MAAHLVIIGSRRDAEAVAALQKALASVNVTVDVVTAEDSDDHAAMAHIFAADAALILLSDELVDSSLGRDLPAISAAAYQGNLVLWRILVRPMQRTVDAGPVEDWTRFGTATEMASAADAAGATVRSWLELFEQRPRHPAAIGSMAVAEAPRIFISHASGDGMFAFALQSKLESRGYRVWTDLGYMRTGDEWRAQIDDGLRGSEAVVVVISPKSTDSSYVTYEWAFACGAGVPVLPIIHQRPKQMHPRLKSMQYLDFTADDPNQWPVDRLADDLRTIIAKTRH
jgi:hypothetical protein